MLVGLSRYIVTLATSKHRFFVFLEGKIQPDDCLVSIALNDAFHLGILSSRCHVAYALAAGGRLGVGNDPRYNKSRCFDPFPFPDCTSAQKEKIRGIGEELDAHRKRVQAKHPNITLTGMYNVLENLRSGKPLTDKEKQIHEQGLVSVLKQLHDDLDSAVFSAYGWSDLGKALEEADRGSIYDFKTKTFAQIEATPEGFAAAIADLEKAVDEQILERVVALNAERAREEANGQIRWLRPEYQCAKEKPAQTKELDLETKPGLVKRKKKEVAIKTAKVKGKKLPWPKTMPEQVKAVSDALRACEVPSTAVDLGKTFSRANPEDITEILETLCIMGQARKGQEKGTYLA